MCRPTYVPRLHGEGSWVANAPPLDPVRALEQWERLRELVSAHVGPVVELRAEPWAPAMTFTRDLGVAADGQLIPLMAHRARGPFEAPLAHRQLAELGVVVVSVGPEPLRLDGGNVLVDSHGRLLIGVVDRELTDTFVADVRLLERATGRHAFQVPLAGGRFPHVDMAVCDLNGRAWLVYPEALAGFDITDPTWADLFVGRPVLLAAPAAGELLGCNLIVSGDVAIGPLIDDELRAALCSHGISYIPTPLSELRKAGGGAHCLTLELPYAMGSGSAS